MEAGGVRQGVALPLCHSATLPRGTTRILGKQSSTPLAGAEVVARRGGFCPRRE